MPINNHVASHFSLTQTFPLFYFLCLYSDIIGMISEGGDLQNIQIHGQFVLTPRRTITLRDTKYECYSVFLHSLSSLVYLSRHSEACCSPFSALLLRYSTVYQIYALLNLQRMSALVETQQLVGTLMLMSLRFTPSLATMPPPDLDLFVYNHACFFHLISHMCLITFVSSLRYDFHLVLAPATREVPPAVVEPRPELRLKTVQEIISTSPYDFPVMCRPC